MKISIDRKKIFALSVKVFIVHLILILLFDALIVHSKLSLGPQDESVLAWMIFITLDFPLSLIIPLTSSGPDPVGVPNFLRETNPFPREVFVDVIWPSLIFQIVGTINWVFILSVYKKYITFSFGKKESIKP